MLQESIPVGCVPPACQPYMFWLLPLDASSSCWVPTHPMYSPPWGTQPQILTHEYSSFSPVLSPQILTSWVLNPWVPPWVLTSWYSTHEYPLTPESYTTGRVMFSLIFISQHLRQYIITSYTISRDLCSRNLTSEFYVQHQKTSFLLRCHQCLCQNLSEMLSFCSVQLEILRWCKIDDFEQLVLTQLGLLLMTCHQMTLLLRYFGAIFRKSRAWLPFREHDPEKRQPDCNSSFSALTQIWQCWQ